jgi:transposase InsO family protein
VCETLEVARASLYRRRAQLELPFPPVRKKRGPRTQYSDAELTEQIRAVLAESLFVGEGHRKVWARLRLKGVRTSKQRTLRLMREASLLAPQRGRRVLGPSAHDGTIITTRPDERWGTDATKGFTVEDGWVTVFIAVDHCTTECVGIHAAKPGTGFEALEPIRQGVKERFGVYAQGIAIGLEVRHDHGSQFVSDLFQRELRFLGAESSPSFVRSPEGNGCAERFIRTLKEQLLWVQTFRNVEELRLALLAFKEMYNRNWLVERHGYRTPAQVRGALELREAA